MSYSSLLLSVGQDKTCPSLFVLDQRIKSLLRDQDIFLEFVSRCQLFDVFRYIA